MQAIVETMAEASFVQDLALLKAEMKGGSRPSLRQLDEVRGRETPRAADASSADRKTGDEIGSVEIDLAFAKLAEKRLTKAEPHIDLADQPVRKLVKAMARDFRLIKESYGSEGSAPLLVRGIQIPGVSVKESSEVGGVVRGKLMLQMYARAPQVEEFRSLFE